MSGGIPYFTQPPECVDVQGHVTTTEGNGVCRGIQFESVWATILSHGINNTRALISWKLKLTSKDLDKVGFYVYRGESPNEMKRLNASPIKISPGLIPEYVDETANLLDHQKNYVYQVVAIEVNTLGEEIQRFSSWTFEVAGIEDPTSLYIITEHCFLFRHTSAGVPVLVFKKRHDGESCPECWDDVLQRVTKSSCMTCAGTGKLEGYYDPIPGWMSIEPPMQASSVSISGENQMHKTTFRFTNYPILRVGDIIVEAKTNEFWRVVNVSTPQRNKVLFLQNGTLDGVNRSDIEHKALIVPNDLRKELVAKLEDRIANDSL